MALAVETIYQHTLKINKQSFWMCFNENHNICSINKNNKEGLDPFDEDKTDKKQREEFLGFMQENFPNTRLTKVFDIAPTSYVIYPYLGSIAIDCKEGDEVYNALCEKYETKGYPKSMGAVFWSMEVKVAKELYENRKENFENF
ncbi:hypothetical protein [Helicobacter burdigaliensis]|uniref:hypothetical protein n=1 Tax=Helicobacter burdigaliensis TaxID=2315334 RepID=UPI000EF65447|nr:hypothetical protein [Helicobacter burdigaliensis]